MKRQRGRGRKPSNPNNRSYESNGPDVKIRGNANQIYEKYLQYARDAQTSGDRIAAEAYFQHAEHYFRIVAANTPKDKLPIAQDDQDDSTDDRSDNDEVDAKSDDREESGKADAMQVVDGDGEQPDQIKSNSDEEKKPRTRNRRPRRKPTENSDAASTSEGGDDAGLRNMLGKTAAPDVSPEPAAEEAK